MTQPQPASGAAATPARLSRAKFAAAALSLGAVHLLLVDYFVPLRAIFARQPIQGVDFDLHIGQVYRVVEGLRGWGKSWVYDVRLLAGHPEGTITDAGSKAWELWTFGLSALGVSLPVAFNTWVLLTMLACPMLVYAAGRCFELSPGASLLAAAMGSTLWFFDSFVHWVWFVGMVSWALASCLCLLTLGLFYAWLRANRPALAIACAVALAVGHLIHPYTFFVLVAPMAALYLRALRQRSVKQHLTLVAMSMFALAINGYWLAVAAQHWPVVVNSAYFAQGKLAYLLFDFLGILRAGEDTGVIGVRSGFRLLWLALGAAGLVRLHQRADPRLLPLAVGIWGVIAFAYAGSLLGVFRQVQPYRTLISACMLSTLPAALFVQQLADSRSLHAMSGATRAGALVLALLGLQHLAQEVLYFVPRALPDVDKFADGGPSPLTKYGFLTRADAPSHFTYALPHDPELEPGYELCIRWLETHVAPGARILVEGSVLGERLAWRTRFEIIGGFLERNVLHAYANYFRRYRQPASQAELASYLRAYSIDWLVSVQAHPEFDASAELRLADTLGLYRMYRTLRPAGRVLRGRGVVSAQTNRIDVTDSEPLVPLVLSYHYHEALRCTPHCKLERAELALDSVGLIRIPAPHPRNLRIYNAYP